MAILDQIDTVVIVILENRTFDHMLGYLSHPQFGNRKNVNGQQKDPAWLARFTNEAGGQKQAPFHTSRLYFADDPKHERDNFRIQFGADFKPGVPYPMNGFMQNYAQNPGLSSGDYREVMSFFAPEDIPITAFLAENYAVCDNWFAPIPTSTQPNRLMAMSGLTHTDNTLSSTVPDQKLLYDWCDDLKVDWRVYHEGWPFFLVMARWRLKILEDAITDAGRFRSLKRLADDLKPGNKLPQILFIEPKYTSDHFSAAIPSDDHAPTSISGGQDFLRRVYCALIANPERWKRTMMIVTYDEGGGQFDHVSPPELETKVVGSTSEPFHTLGIRVPALIVSPLVKRGSVFPGLMDHTSILRMIGEKFGDQGKYSPEVNNRPLVGSVTEILEHPDCRVEQVRADIPQPPPFSPQDSFVRGRSFRPATPDEQAFAYALSQMRENDRERAVKKFPKLADFFTARENLLWELAKAIVKSKDCRLGDCARDLQIYLEAHEKEIQRNPSLVAIAYASVTKLVNQMIAEARAAGSHEISQASFLSSKPKSLF